METLNCAIINYVFSYKYENITDNINYMSLKILIKHCIPDEIHSLILCCHYGQFVVHKQERKRIKIHYYLAIIQ